MKVEFETNDLLSISEAIKALGIARMTLYRWMKEGRIHTVMFGGYRAIHRSEVERMQRAKGLNDGK